ncbi:MAG: FAD-dependent oxidoreductase [Planktomarina sp.]|jgi:3-phenylpropionate/trans-cinnamate dioxygenase ferredoxin reductase subunit|nr:FAD-dependent oxidoreductase [Planktomarina sp.]MDT2057045.1 FAD-dependent oxidoreductase [Planktomarina sp.]MDT2072716.1 FAD-dependent oxidoreductase [Planktomarina sp.]MDT2077405.1 FAD-dependent oxidoreductase [Planktomarina sp.]|tara:strand:- start:706 stop:1911 length:1206 start_codon:yes stop_codon:yes gene_type:complete
MSGIVIIGAGQAGASLAIKLRALGYKGDVTLIGEEKFLPYQRPPLSKKYLLGDMALDRLYLRPRDFYTEQLISLRLGAHVTAINPTAKTISIGDETISYDHLALTTGSTPRLLPAAIGGRLNGVFAVRSLADVGAMQPAFESGGHVLIIGGGYIGLEAAAVAAAKGLKVTLVEMADRILQRVACAETSDYFRTLHQSHGVTILEGVGLERLTGEGHVNRAILSNGEALDIDFAIVGVGILPGTSLAEAAGLTLNNGIETNSHSETSIPSIWAAGDCASFPYKGDRIRLESVPNAIDQAEIVATNMLGAGKDYVATPWFWSDQYEVKLQIAGLNTGFTDVVVRDSGATRSHWYYKSGALLAVDAMNDPRAYMVAKRLIEAGKSVDPSIAADPQSDLKALLQA